MDSLSIVIGVLAPIAVVVIIVVALRAIVRADRREDEALATMDTRPEGDNHQGAAERTTTTDHETHPPRRPLPGDDENSRD
jgi:hypothetical protein